MTPQARYALAVLLGLLGVPARDSEEAVAQLAVRSDDDWNDPRPDPARLRPPRRIGDFDLLYAAYACLTAPWERIDPTDEVGCPVAGAGWLARHGLLDEPLVHRYAALLGEILRVSSRPRGVVVLTHDVDDNFAHLFAVSARLALLRRDLRDLRPAALRRALGVARSGVRRRRADPNDRFDEWTAWHREWRSRPTYFVASRGLLAEGSDARDVAYDVRHPDVRATIAQAAAAGAEIGIHFSIGARESPERLRREREELADAVGVPVRSSRHHWWALGTPAERTLVLHAAAGIEVDCSLGFNDRAGFRRGIAAPFRPFDHEAQRAADVWAVPTIAMDAALVRGEPLERAVDELARLWRVVDEVGGALVLDWHVHAANPAAFPGAAAVLKEFLDGAKPSMKTPLELVA